MLERQAEDRMVVEGLTRAVILHCQGLFTEADQAYREVLRHSPEQPDALNLLGLVLHQRGDSESGLELMIRSVQLDPSNATSHYNLGNAFRDVGRFDEASCAYREAIRLQPGDADIRCSLGAVLNDLGRSEEAETELRKVLKVQPRHLQACIHLAALLLRDGRKDEAREFVEQWLVMEPGQPCARHLLGACDNSQMPLRAADDCIRAIFDPLAETFDHHVRNLGYSGPKVVGRVLAEMAGKPAGQLDVLDAGCGTGLCGPQLAPYAKRLVGVDLSRRMIDKARGRGCYDTLIAAELTDHLKGCAAAYDLIVCADTLVYFGELSEVAHGLARALRPGGLFVFTLEKEGAAYGEWGYRLNGSGRYSHRQDYVELVLAETGLEIQALTCEVLRYEGGEPVRQFVFTARKGIRC